MKTSSRQTSRGILSTLGIALAVGVAGCSGGGSSGGGGGGLAGAGVSLGQLLPGQAGQFSNKYGNAISQGADALTMSENEEPQLGRAVAIAATNRWPLYDNANVSKYVTLVGMSVASVSSNPTWEWTFGVLDTPEVGAYSGPSGFIMITRGALSAMQDESELAGVLAHEIGHCVNHDGLSALKASKLVGAGVEAGTAQIKDPVLAGFAKNSDVLSKIVLNVGWNQGQETNADAKGVQLLAAAGYDPNGLTRFLKRMQERGIGNGKAFGTHPGLSDRIAHTSSLAGNRPGATNKERFAKATAEAKL
jgi:predicted Zn-dependent protease